MDRYQFLIILSLFFLPLQSQDYFDKPANQNKNHLLIMHPTRSNLERYSFLIESGLLKPGKNKIVGIYFKEENYDYSNVIEDFPGIGFHEIEGINKNKVFSENELSAEFKKIFNNSKGVIFNGGPDIPPDLYKEEMSTLTSVTDPNRHFGEISLLFHLIGNSENPDFIPFLKSRPRYMVFGICLGMQSMNVANGGNMVQDIPSEIYNITTIEEILSSPAENQHRNYYSNYSLFPEIRSYFLHPIDIVNGRWMHKKVKTKNKQPYVFSSHHQAIDELAQDYRITASSVDGKIIEGIEHLKYPNVIGIQFHPEVDYLYKNEKAYKFKPEDENFSLLQKLKENNSYEFHVNIWNEVSKMIR
jgi:putative glutamine amidotransferase